MIILRQKSFAKGFREYDKIKKLQERYDYESNEYGKDSTEAQKTMNRIIRENSILDSRSKKYGQKHTKTARQMGGYNNVVLYKYGDVAPHILFSPHNKEKIERLQELRDLEKEKYKDIELSENGKNFLMNESSKRLKESNIVVIKDTHDIDKFIDTLSEEDAEKLIDIYSKERSAKETLRENLNKDLNRGVDGTYVAFDNVNKKSYAVLPQNIPVQSIAHEIIGHGDGVNYGDTVENPIRASMQDFPNYYLRTENAANQKVLNLSKGKISEDDNKMLKNAYNAQEKSNMYDIHSEELFKYNNNEPVDGPLFGSTNIKKSNRR